MEHHAMIPIDKIDFHVEVKEIPCMREAEWEEFNKDVALVGVKDSILVVRQGDRYLLLDGRHRVKAAKGRGDTEIPAEITVLSAADQAAEVYRHAFLRRGLSDEQRAMVAARFYEIAAAAARSGRAATAGRAGGRSRPRSAADSSALHGDAELLDRASDPEPGAAPPPPRKPRLVEQMAKESNLPVNMIKDAIDLQKSDPQAAEEVRQGKTTIRGAKRRGGRKQAVPRVLPIPKAPEPTDIVKAIKDYKRQVPDLSWDCLLPPVEAISHFLAALNKKATDSRPDKDNARKLVRNLKQVAGIVKKLEFDLWEPSQPSPSPTEDNQNSPGQSAGEVLPLAPSAPSEQILSSPELAG